VLDPAVVPQAVTVALQTMLHLAAVITVRAVVHVGPLGLQLSQPALNASAFQTLGGCVHRDFRNGLEKEAASGGKPPGITFCCSGSAKLRSERAFQSQCTRQQLTHWWHECGEPEAARGGNRVNYTVKRRVT